MKDTKAKQWKEVDERFDKEFTCIVTYEKWPDEEEQRLREPQYKFKDFPNTNPKIIKNFLHSELEKVRQETEQRHQGEMEELRRKTLDEVLEVIKGEKTGHSSYSCQKKEGGLCICGANEDRWNLAIDQISQQLKNKVNKK